MTVFSIEPARPGDASKIGWVVKSTHENGLVETSVIYKTQILAETAADGWKYLEEDWDKV